jgi:hypothetical protein
MLNTTRLVTTTARKRVTAAGFSVTAIGGSRR